MKKVSDILPLFISSLKDIYPIEEIKNIAYISIDYHLSFNRSDTILYSENEISTGQYKEIQKIIFRLKKGEPIQYILSETIFYGLRMIITNGALIPRPETEELVDWIIKDNRGREKSYLDIGTGSGCIIITLARHLEGRFDAIDVSINALEVANENCIKSKIDVKLIEFDIMQDDLFDKWDVIVSNPPYVLESEREYMRENVLDNEPDIALFVNDNNPLEYYEKIACQANNSLNKNGLLYFEINEKFGKEIVEMLTNKGFVNIELKKDINDKDRMVKAVKK